jgi:hypothetical protein
MIKIKCPLRLPQKLIAGRELGLLTAYSLGFWSGAGRGSLFFGDPILPVVMGKFILINNFRIGGGPLLA